MIFLLLLFSFTVTCAQNGIIEGSNDIHQSTSNQMVPITQSQNN